MNSVNHSKQERLAEFLRRLLATPHAGTFDEALQQLRDILNAVENEITDLPYNPETSQTDGRMYPPELDGFRDVPGMPRVKRYRHRRDNTYVGDNGSIAIRRIGVSLETTIFGEPGSDGKTLSEL